MRWTLLKMRRVCVVGNGRSTCMHTQTNFCNSVIVASAGNWPNAVAVDATLRKCVDATRINKINYSLHMYANMYTNKQNSWCSAILHRKIQRYLIAYSLWVRKRARARALATSDYCFILITTFCVSVLVRLCAWFSIHTTLGRETTITHTHTLSTSIE